MSEQKTEPPVVPPEPDPVAPPRQGTTREIIREKGGCWKGLVVVGITFIIVVWLGYRCARDVVRTSAEAVGQFGSSMETEETMIDISSVVTQIKGLSRLETASMNVVQLITARQSHGIIPDAIAGDELTLVAVGEVIAGIDLSKLREEDARVENGTLILRLPRAEILVTRLDNAQSRVVNRDTGLLRKADKGLEGRTRERAEIAIRNKALKEGIRDIARNNAETQLAEFLLKLGAESVQFESDDQPVVQEEIEH